MAKNRGKKEDKPKRAGRPKLTEAQKEVAAAKKEAELADLPEIVSVDEFYDEDKVLLKLDKGQFDTSDTKGKLLLMDYQIERLKKRRDDLERRGTPKGKAMAKKERLEKQLADLEAEIAEAEAEEAEAEEDEA